MRPSVRLRLPLALLAGLTFGLSGASAQAGSTPAAPTPGATAPAPQLPPRAATTPSSTTPSLGDAFGPSSPDQIALADHLRSKGVIFYGAFWCQHCFHQKALFGQQAGNRLPYVECAKDAAGAQACSAAEVLAYPTWVMGKERRVGVQSLKDLAAWTQYTGPANFSAGKPGL